MRQKYLQETVSSLSVRWLLIYFHSCYLEKKREEEWKTINSRILKTKQCTIPRIIEDSCLFLGVNLLSREGNSQRGHRMLIRIENTRETTNSSRKLDSAHGQTIPMSGLTRQEFIVLILELLTSRSNYEFIKRYTAKTWRILDHHSTISRLY